MFLINEYIDMLKESLHQLQTVGTINPELSKQLDAQGDKVHDFINIIYDERIEQIIDEERQLFEDDMCDSICIKEAFDILKAPAGVQK